MNSLSNIFFAFFIREIGLFSVNGYTFVPENYRFDLKNGLPLDNYKFIQKKFVRSDTLPTTTFKPETIPETEYGPVLFPKNEIPSHQIFYSNAEEYSYLEPHKTDFQDVAFDIQPYSFTHVSYPSFIVNNPKYEPGTWPENFSSQNVDNPLVNFLNGYSYISDGRLLNQPKNPTTDKLIRTLTNRTHSPTTEIYITTKSTPITKKPDDHLIDLRVFSESTTSSSSLPIMLQNLTSVLTTDASNTSKNGSETQAEVTGYFQDANGNLCVREKVELPGKVLSRYTCVEKDFNENKTNHQKTDVLQNVTEVPTLITKSMFPTASLNFQSEKTTTETAALTENDLRNFVSCENTFKAEPSTINDFKMEPITESISETQ